MSNHKDGPRGVGRETGRNARTAVVAPKRESLMRSVGSRILGRSVSREEPRKGFLRDTIESLFVALIIFLLIRTFAFQAFRIPTGSMENTLLPGDFLFIDKFAYGARVPFTQARLPGFTHPKRGDIIVFEFPRDLSQDYIKRCIGLPGDVIEVRDKELFLNGAKQTEPYVVHKVAGISQGLPDQFGPYKVPAGSLFMMGDNRDQSFDSRYWGTVDLHLVHGKAWFTYFSLDPQKHLPRPKRMFRLIR